MAISTSSLGTGARVHCGNELVVICGRVFAQPTS